jgi:membrane protease YdiL (CAAX protease family)
LCEELGWRGYALPRLLTRFSPFTASLILGVIWGVWHLPSFFLSGMEQNGMSLTLFIIYTPCLSILMTWVFQHTHGSVLSAVMIHYMANICTTILGVTLPTLGIILLTGSILVLVFDKQFGWFHSSNFDRHIVSIGETK